MTDHLHSHSEGASPAPDHGGHGGHGGHGWMMMICCIPKVIIAVSLVAAGAIDASFLLFAAMCVGMMALMMKGMGGMDHGSDQSSDEPAKRAWLDRQDPR